MPELSASLTGEAVKGECMAYGVSKASSERAAWSFVEKEKPQFTLTTILPTAIAGPSATQVLDKTGIMRGSPGIVGRPLLDPSYDLTQPVRGQSGDRTDVQGLITNRSRGYVVRTNPTARLTPQDVRDTAQAHVLAATKDEAVGKRFILQAPELTSGIDVLRDLKTVFPERASTMCKIPDGNALPTRGAADGSRVTRELGLQYRPLQQTFRDQARDTYARADELGFRTRSSSSS